MPMVHSENCFDSLSLREMHLSGVGQVEVLIGVLPQDRRNFINVSSIELQQA